MVRILVDVPNDKAVWVSLTYIFGIGNSTAKKICKKLGIDSEKKAFKLSDSELVALRNEINNNYLVEGNLRREVSKNISILSEIGSYRGLRHRKGLPVRGQRTKTNARTCKGPRKTIANKKEAKKQG